MFERIRTAIAGLLRLGADSLVGPGLTSARASEDAGWNLVTGGDGPADRDWTSIRQDLEEIKKSYGDPRRTIITTDEPGVLTEDDLIPREEVLISITQRGYIKRIPASTYRPQGRGGRGLRGVSTTVAGDVRHLLPATTLDEVLFFTNRGRLFSLRAHEIPETSRQARGLPRLSAWSMWA